MKLVSKVVHGPGPCQAAQRPAAAVAQEVGVVLGAVGGVEGPHGATGAGGLADGVLGVVLALLCW